MDRVTQILGAADHSSRIIEIGPSHSPIAPRSAGWDTHIVDHADRAELCRKYIDAGVALDSIEDVDSVWTGGPLHKAVPTALHGSFDTLIASHVIEHLPDPVGFLISAAILLKPGGVVSLAVPDKRFCFDYFKPLTTTGDLLEAYAQRRSRHPLRVAWNHLAYSVKSNGRIGWGQEPVGPFGFCHEFAAASRVPSDYRDDGLYQDYHAWHFTPASFSLIIFELGILGLVDWHVAELHGPCGLEFYATLRPGQRFAETPASLQAQRITLLCEQMIELQVQLEFGREGGALPGASPDQIQITQQHLEEVQADLSAAIIERDTLRAERDAITSERDALKASMSWRLTAPLLRLKGSIRTLFPNGAGSTR